MSGIQRTGGQSGIDPSQFDQGVDSAQTASQAGQAGQAGQTGQTGGTAAAQRMGRSPGEIADRSGQYVLRDARGNQVGKQYTITAGEPFPPARPGLGFHLVDATKHSGGAGEGGRVVLGPGSKAPVSGQYELVDASGKGLDQAATVVKGEPLPPSLKAGQKWKLVDMTGTKRPGEKSEISGQYQLIDSNGKKVKNSEATVVKGEKFPATPKAGQAWKLADVTKHVDTEKMKGDFKPGQLAKTSGQYAVIGADGSKTGREVTVAKGEPFPPARGAGQTYKLIDKTNP